MITPLLYLLPFLFPNCQLILHSTKTDQTTEFNPSDLEADDDEETLLKAEEEDGMNLDGDDDDEDGDDSGGADWTSLKKSKKDADWKSRVEEELEALRAEGEKPIDELLKDLPPEVLQKPASPLPQGGYRNVWCCLFSG